MGLCNADSVDKQKQLVPVHTVIVQTVLEEVVTVLIDLLQALAGQLVNGNLICPLFDRLKCPLFDDKVLHVET